MCPTCMADPNRLTARWRGRRPMKATNSQALAIAVTALSHIAPDFECENFTSGIGSCFRDGRTVDAANGADRCCDSCIAHDALDRINNLLGEEALSNAAKKIGPKRSTTKAEG